MELSWKILWTISVARCNCQKFGTSTVYQAFNEQIHSETYSKLLEVYVGDESDVKELLDEAKRNPAVQAKTEFAKKHFEISKEEEPNRDRNFAKRLIAFACVEGINFSSSFCGIYWIKKTDVWGSDALERIYLER